jgi:trk system potassium uptake protein TrkA
MKILILGAGQVGTSVAAALVREGHDVTVIDTDAERLRELSEKIDLRAIHGFAAHPSVLARGGAEDADVLVAVTSSDEVNMVACEVAATLYRTPIKIARVRTLEYLKHPELFGRSHVAIDHLISPSQRVCAYIERLIQYPGTLQVLDFAGGRAQLVGVRARQDGALVGHQIRDLAMHLPVGSEVRIAGIFRNRQPVVADGDTVIELGDEVFFLADKKSIRAMLAEFHRIERPARRVMLAGGGNIGQELARQLEIRYSVKVIERSRERARVIAEALENSIVLVGDCADEDLLREENIDQTDVYCALTNDDEANILSALLAKRLGARRVISLVNRPAYIDLIESGDIDTAVSPQQITLGALLSCVRQGNLVRVHSLRGGAVEALEAVAIGNSASSRVVGRPLNQIDLPKGASIVGVVRGERVLAAHHDTVIEADDHVILFIVDKRDLKKVELLFRAGVTSL